MANIFGLPGHQLSENCESFNVRGEGLGLGWSAAIFEVLPRVSLVMSSPLIAQASLWASEPTGRTLHVLKGPVESQP